MESSLAHLFGCKWVKNDTCSQVSYVVFGGVPYYLAMLDQQKSLPQNIDELLFHPDGQLHNEYTNLYQAMFRNAENHLTIVSAIAIKSKGMTRNEILEQTGLPNAGSTTRILEELEQSDFIRRYVAFGQKKRRHESLVCL